MFLKSIYFGQNICRRYKVLPQFPFNTSETGLDYYLQKVNLRVASRVDEPDKKTFKFLQT